MPLVMRYPIYIKEVTDPTSCVVPSGCNLTQAQEDRIGFHNDCFLASDDDFGTFLSNPLSLDEDYLAADSQYVPVGGETCAVNPPKSEWPSAMSGLSHRPERKCSSI